MPQRALNAHGFGNPRRRPCTWTAPNNGAAITTTYIVTPFFDEIALTPHSFPSAATTETITGLTSGQTYTFTVAAKNSRGPGRQSAPSNAVTPT